MCFRGTITIPEDIALIHSTVSKAVKHAIYCSIKNGYQVSVIKVPEGVFVEQHPHGWKIGSAVQAKDIDNKSHYAWVESENESFLQVINTMVVKYDESNQWETLVEFLPIEFSPNVTEHQKKTIEAFLELAPLKAVKAFNNWATSFSETKWPTSIEAFDWIMQFRLQK